MWPRAERSQPVTLIIPARDILAADELGENVSFFTHLVPPE